MQLKTRILITGLAIIFYSTTANAQKRKHAIQAGVETGIPIGDFSDFGSGLGVYGKLLLGVATTGHITLSKGGSAYELKRSNQFYQERTRIKQLLAGYRFSKHSLYIEPQAGVGTYCLITKVHDGNTMHKTVDKKKSFTWALGGGVQVRRFDVGARFQQGYPSGNVVGLFMLHAGYQINF